MGYTRGQVGAFWVMLAIGEIGVAALLSSGTSSPAPFLSVWLGLSIPGLIFLGIAAVYFFLAWRQRSAPASR